jgi:hypothetical protein
MLSSARISTCVEGVVFVAGVTAWTAALDSKGDPREDADLVEITDRVDLSGRPPAYASSCAASRSAPSTRENCGRTSRPRAFATRPSRPTPSAVN